MLNRIEDLQPLKNDKFFNVNNTFSAKGLLEGKKVKIYSLPSQDRIDLRLYIEETPVKKYFPRVLDYSNEFIVEEWIDAPTLKQYNKKITKEQKNNVYKIIKDLKEVNYDKIVFDYVDFIFDRLKLLDHPLRSSINELDIPPLLNHNDLNFDNILITKENNLVIIDNEHLNYSKGWILCLKNSFLKEDKKFYNKYISDNDVNALWEIRTRWKK